MNLNKMAQAEKLTRNNLLHHSIQSPDLQIRVFLWKAGGESNKEMLCFNIYENEVQTVKEGEGN